MTLFVLSFFLLPGRLKWYLLGATLITVFLSWGKNMMWFTDLFADYFPMYSKFRSVSSILVVAELVIPLMAALAVVEMVKNPDILKQKRKALYISFGLTGGIALLFAIAPGLFFNFLSEQESQYFLPQAAQNNQVAAIIGALENVRMGIFRSDAWRSVFIAGETVAQSAERYGDTILSFIVLFRGYTGECRSGYLYAFSSGRLSRFDIRDFSIQARIFTRI